MLSSIVVRNSAGLFGSRAPERLAGSPRRLLRPTIRSARCHPPIADAKGEIKVKGERKKVKRKKIKEKKRLKEKGERKKGKGKRKKEKGERKRKKEKGERKKEKEKGERRKGKGWDVKVPPLLLRSFIGISKCQIHRFHRPRWRLGGTSVPL